MTQKIRAFLLVSPAMILLVVFFAALTTVLSMSVRNPAGDFTFANYIRFVNDTHFLGYLWRSIRVASYVTLVALIAGYPIAYVMSRGSRRFASIITLALAIQFFSIYVIKMYGWMLMLGNNGVINRFLKYVGLTDAPVRLMYNELGVAIGLFASALPLMVFPISSVLQNVSAAMRKPPTALAPRRCRLSSVSRCRSARPAWWVARCCLTSSVSQPISRPRCWAAASSR